MPQKLRTLDLYYMPTEIFHIDEQESAKEKRVEPRVSFDESVQFQFKDPQKFGGCLACDISESGIRVYVNDFIPLNTELMLQMQLPSKNMVDCVGRVVWVTEVPYSSRYQAGLEFVNNEASHETKKEIGQYIQSQK